MFGKLKNLKRKNFKRAVIGLLCVPMVLTSSHLLAGCSKKSDTTQLTVYYVKKAIGYEQALNDYKQLVRGVELNCVGFDSEDEMEDKIAVEMAAGKGPDVILLSNNSKLDVYKAEKGNNFADLTKYMNEDNSMNEDNYYLDIIDACKMNEKQYILPFNFDINLFYMKQSILNKLGMEQLDAATNYKEFFNKICDYQKILAIDSNDNIGMSTPSYNIKNSITLVNCFRDIGMGVLDSNSDLKLDKEQMRTIFSLMKSIGLETADKKDRINANVGTRLALGSVDSMFMNYAEAPSMISILNCILNEASGDCLDFQAVPTSDGTGYAAQITYYGVINSNCKNIQSGYNLLKFVMNYKSPLTMRQYMYVNKELYNEKMSKIALGGTVWQIGNGEKYALLPWNREKLQKFNDIVNSIKKAQVTNIRIEEIIANTMQDYMSDQNDFDTCFDNLQRQLLLYMQE